MISLRTQEYYVPGLSNYLWIISPQGICTSEVFKGTLIAHFNVDLDIYAELKFKEDNPGC